MIMISGNLMRSGVLENINFLVKNLLLKVILLNILIFKNYLR